MTRHERTRNHFALVSRAARVIEVSLGALCGWFPAQNEKPTDVYLVLVLASLLIASSVLIVALAPSRRIPEQQYVRRVGWGHRGAQDRLSIV